MTRKLLDQLASKPMSRRQINRLLAGTGLSLAVMPVIPRRASAADQAAIPGCSIAPTWVSSASTLEPNVTLRNVACCGLSVEAENSTCTAPDFGTTSE